MELSPVKTTLRIALVGDYNPDVIAHQAIPLAIDDAAAVLDLTADYDWLATTELTSPKIWWVTMPSGWFLQARIKMPKPLLLLRATHVKTACHSLGPAVDSSTR
jgi:hypothetical protein